MGKFIYAVLMVFAIELAMWLFVGPTYGDTSLFDMLLDPSNLVNNIFYLAVVGIIGWYALSAIIPGNFIQVNIYALYAGMAAVFITFSLSIVHLYTFLYGQLTAASISPELGQLITVVITAPLLLFYIIAVSEWVRSNQ